MGSYSNIVWLDLELTHGHYEGIQGGDHEGQWPQILEAAIVVTNKDLEELGRGHWVLGGFTKAELESLPSFHQTHFRDAETGGEFPPLQDFAGNGLFSEIIASQMKLEEVESLMLALVSKHCPERACPVAGNSVQCDREVLRARMPKLHAHFSHQIIDMSTPLQLLQRWAPLKKEAWREDQNNQANYNHRAINDVESSIQSAKWMRTNLICGQTAP